MILDIKREVEFFVIGQIMSVISFFSNIILNTYEAFVSTINEIVNFVIFLATTIYSLGSVMIILFITFKIYKFID